MMHENKPLPQGLEEMFAKATESGGHGFQWVFDKDSDWIIPWVNSGAGYPIIPEKSSIKSLIASLQKFCSLVSDQEIEDFNSTQKAALDKNELGWIADEDKKLELPIKKRSLRGGWVYLAHLPENDLYKIGMASDVEARLSGLQTGSPYRLQLIHKIKTTNPKELEQSLHRICFEYRVQGEWFRLPPKMVAQICLM